MKAYCAIGFSRVSVSFMLSLTGSEGTFITLDKYFEDLVYERLSVLRNNTNRMQKNYGHVWSFGVVRIIQIRKL